MRSRNDSSASCTCGRMMSANNHSSAGVSSTASIMRRRHTAGLEVSDMRAARGGGSGGRCGEADRALRVEAEEYLRARFQVREPPGLWQRDAKLETRLLLHDQHRGIGAIEQQALDFAGVTRHLRRQLRSVEL